MKTLNRLYRDLGKLIYKNGIIKSQSINLIGELSEIDMVLRLGLINIVKMNKLLVNIRKVTMDTKA